MLHKRLYTLCDTMNICIDNIPSHTPCICTIVNALIQGVSLKKSARFPKKMRFLFCFQLFPCQLEKVLRTNFWVTMTFNQLMQCLGQFSN